MDDVDDVLPLVSKSSVAAALNCRSVVRGVAYLPRVRICHLNVKMPFKQQKMGGF